MNRALVMGLFALILSLVALWRVLGGREDARLIRLSRSWGRRTGLAIFFILHVALPVLFGILYFCQGVVAYAQGGIAWDLAAGLPVLRNYLPGHVAALIPPLEPLYSLDLLVP